SLRQLWATSPRVEHREKSGSECNSFWNLLAPIVGIHRRNCTLNLSFPTSMNRTHFGIAIFCALSLIGADAHAQTWKPSPGHTQTPIWPGTPPDAQQNPKPESVVTTSHLVAGRHYMAVLNVSRPTMTIYPAMEKNTGAAVVVLPGGGFNSLAIDLEGTETCDWLTAKGITCVLLKYRVPSTPYD